MYECSIKASQRRDLSYGSIDCNILTLERNYSYLSLFLLEASLTMLLKVSLSKLHSIVDPSEVIVAALGALYKRANSPKASPGWYFLRMVGSDLPGKILEQIRLPLSTTNNSLPLSPSVMTLSPF